MSDRNQKLIAAAKTGADMGNQFKLDTIAYIYINGRQYFQVFRRYNSVYEFVIEDMNGDLYFHPDTTVRDSLQRVLCLSSEQADHMFTDSAFSYKYNAPITGGMPCDLVDTHWTYIQGRFEAVQMNVKGILTDFPQNYVYETPVKTEATQTIEAKPTQETKPTQEELEAANTLLSLQIPRVDGFHQSVTDMPEMSMRWASLSGTKRSRQNWTCHCDMDSDSDTDESNYTVLRNGTMIPKRFM